MCSPFPGQNAENPARRESWGRGGQRNAFSAHSFAAQLRPDESMPLTDVGCSEDLLAELAEWVKLETPTTDPAAVNLLMDRAEAELARAGATLQRIPGRNGFGDTLIARTPGEGRPALVAGHLDTVWSTGTITAMPYRVDGE